MMRKPSQILFSTLTVFALQFFLYGGCSPKVHAPDYSNSSSCPRNVLVSKDPSCCNLSGDLISPAPAGCAGSDGDTSGGAAMISGFSNLTFASANLDQADLLISPMNGADVSMLSVSDPGTFAGGGGVGSGPLFGGTGPGGTPGSSGGSNEAPKGNPATGGLSVESATLGDLSNGATVPVTSGTAGLENLSPSGKSAKSGGASGSGNSSANSAGNDNAALGSAAGSAPGSSGASDVPPAAGRSFLPGIPTVLYLDGGTGARGKKNRDAGSDIVATNATYDGMGLTIRTPAAIGYSTLVGGDPQDYFSRIAPDENLFKRVNRRYREKESAMILNALPRR